MKKALFALSAALLAGVVMLSGCSGGNLLYAAAEHTDFSYGESEEADFLAVQEGVSDFSARFAAAATAESAKSGTENTVVSPVSVYMGLSLAAMCAGGETQTELLNALGVDEATLSAGAPELWRSLNRDFGKRGEVSLSNSVWLQEGIPFEDACLQSLAEDFFADSYSADFAGNNDAANRALTDYIKDKTNGLIKADLQLPQETLFALVNTLYLKDTWNERGRELPVTEDMPFVTGAGSETLLPFMQAEYHAGRPFEGENFTAFSALTCSGFSLTFLLPDEGVPLSDVFTAENLAAVQDIDDWNAVDEENRIHYYTRCIFPAFEGGCDMDAREILKDEFGIELLFDEKNCDLTPLVGAGNNAYCFGAKHVATLKVDRRGIEGAAVFVLPGAGDAGPDEYTEVHQDFVVDRAFGFVLSDLYDTPLFAGVVNEV